MKSDTESQQIEAHQPFEDVLLFVDPTQDPVDCTRWISGVSVEVRP